MRRVTHVLDACSVACYLKGEPGSAALAALLADPRNTVAIHQVTLVDLCARFQAADGREMALAAWGKCSEAMLVETLTTEDFAKRAMRWLGGGVASMTDAYAGATAEESGATLVVYAGGPLAQAAVSFGIRVMVAGPASSATPQETPVAVEQDPNATSRGGGEAAERLDLGP
jgi:uncharacterized protein with PIN domain